MDDALHEWIHVYACKHVPSALTDSAQYNM